MNYKGVKFGDKHTSTYGIVLSDKTIDTPEPKTESVDIPGADGSIDMTELLGSVKYKNRKINLIFSIVDKRNAALLETYSAILADLHGKHFESIVLDDDPGYKYIGRVTGVTLSSSDSVPRISIEIDCEPYKQSVNLNVVAFTAGTSGGAVSIDFGTKKVTAKIHIDCSSLSEVPEWIVHIDNAQYATYDVSDISLPIKGNHSIFITPHYSSGTVVVVSAPATISYPTLKL